MGIHPGWGTLTQRRKALHDFRRCFFGFEEVDPRDPETERRGDEERGGRQHAKGSEREGGPPLPAPPRGPSARLDLVQLQLGGDRAT